MKGLYILLAIFIGGISFSRGQEIPVRQESLGQWHYLHDLGMRPFDNTQGPPVAVTFGPNKDRAAVLLPGSYLLAEFKMGHFLDLHLPAELMPSSLGCDPKNGRLFCLAQRKDVTMTNWTERWMTALDSRGWSRPERTPIDPCDRLVFDKQNRLWALGPAGSVACLDHGKWNSYSYDDDTKLHYAPIRLASNPAGDPVLFADWEPPRDNEISHLLGTLIYRSGNFAHDPGAETTGLVQAEVSMEAADSAVPSDASAGYLIQKDVGWMRARTRIDFGGYTIVSLGANGLAWTGPADAPTPPLSVEKEWEPIFHVQSDPVFDSQGNLWVLRRNPSVLQEVTARGTDQFPIGPATRHPELLTTINFDTQGRLWLTRSCGTFGEVDILEHGEFVHYPDLASALRAEAPQFAPGRILPFATKTPSGVIAYGGWNGEADAITVMDHGKETRFEASDIDPSEPANRPTTGHGYNPFRNSDLWFDKDGFLHTRVLDSDFKYADGKWTSSTLTQEKDSVIPPLPIDELGPDTSKVMPWKTSKTIFRGFHFYRAEGNEEKQLDFGLNPLATYPFSSGFLPAILDPQARIWAGGRDINVHPNDATWYIERKDTSAGPK